MTRRAMGLVLVLLLVAVPLLGGCKRSAAPELEPLPEDEMMMEEAAQNTTPQPQEPPPTTPAVATEESPQPTPTMAMPTPVPTPVQPTPTPLPPAPSGEGGEETPAPVEPTPVPPGGPTVHVVQPGENLFRIAMRYNTTVEAIAQENGITNPRLIRVGQKLRIPSGEGAPGGETTGDIIHVVQPGENLFRIALKYNYDYFYLARYNGISNPSLVYPGQKIRIPRP